MKEANFSSLVDKQEKPVVETGIAAVAPLTVLNADVKLVGTNLENSGPLLITHWGVSGPAILKLSAFGARILADKNYQYNVEINWLGQDFDATLDELTDLKSTHISL